MCGSLKACTGAVAFDTRGKRSYYLVIACANMGDHKHESVPAKMGS